MFCQNSFIISICHFTSWCLFESFSSARLAIALIYNFDNSLNGLTEMISLHSSFVLMT
tara:strand:- start:1259 stop:1432 length:174 start_codon:yes stop_codon:yes gene_type:complete